MSKKKTKPTIIDLLEADWGNDVFEEPTPTKAEIRKGLPVFTGVICYFPDAIIEISKASLAGNKQHLDGEPLHWDRSKSKDQLDAAARHLFDHARGDAFDDDGVRHLTKCAWRILAQIQLEIEKEKLTF